MWMLVLIPILMLADYYLTLWGALLRRQGKYSQHIIVDSYELNPTWQQDVARLRWFNPRHLLNVVAVTFLLATLWWLDISMFMFIFVLSSLCTMYLHILGRHLEIILAIRHLERNPDSLQGQITISHQSSLSLSISKILPTLLPFLLAAVVLGKSPHLWGAVAVCS